MSPAPALAVPGAHGDTLESRTGLGLGRSPQPVCCAPRALQGVGQHRAPTPRLAPASPRSEKAGEAGAVGTSPAASRPRAAVQGAATCAPPSACHSPPCPRHGPLRVSGAVCHRLLSVQTPSHSVRPTVVLTCVSLTTGGLTVSCRRCSYLRSLGMSACTLFSCGDSMALPSEGCWPLRALEGVPLFHSWQSL